MQWTGTVQTEWHWKMGTALSGDRLDSDRGVNSGAPGANGIGGNESFQFSSAACWSGKCAVRLG